MGEDTLYTIIGQETTENNTFLTEISINPSHEIFKGHFPKQPVTPGVCLTQMVTDCISYFYKTEHRMISADFIKFTAVVIPSEYSNLFVSVQFSPNSDENTSKIEAKLFHKEKVFLKIRGIFEKK